MGSFLGLKAEAVLWKKLARTIVCVVVLCSAHDASSQDSGGITNEVVIGGLGIMGKEILYSQWNDTFSVCVPIHCQHISKFCIKKRYQIPEGVTYH